MGKNGPILTTLQATMFVSGMLAAVIGAETQVSAQQFEDLKTPEALLVLKEQGSFFVGGEMVEQTSVELGSFGPADQITINQMYVEFMVPDGAERCRW